MKNQYYLLITTHQYTLTFTTELGPVGIPEQNQRIHKSTSSGTVQHDAQLNADHNTQQTNPAAGQLKATDTLQASTNTISFCTVLTTTPPAQVTILCSSKLPLSLSITAYKCVQSLAKREPRVVLELTCSCSHRNLEQVWEKNPPKNMKESLSKMYENTTLRRFWSYKSLYVPIGGPMLTVCTLYENRAENEFTEYIFWSHLFSSLTRTAGI
jgi:hypothetical protein